MIIREPWLSDDSWQHAGMKGPKPLQLNNNDKPEFPIDALPSLFRETAEAIADKAQCPIDFAACSLLAVGSLAIQPHLYVVGPKYQTITSLHFASIGKSGERKSSCDNLAMKPVFVWQDQFLDQHEQAEKQYKINLARWKKAFEKILSKGLTPEATNEIIRLGPEPERPLRPERITGDVTTEGLFHLFRKGNPSLGLFTAEGGTFVGGWGMNKDNRLKSGAWYSESWDGIKPLTRARGAKDEIDYVKNRRLAMHIMLQDEVADELYGMDILRTQGWLSRVLAYKPESLIGDRLYKVDDERTNPSLERYYATMWNILNYPIPTLPGKLQEVNPYPIHLTGEATERWIEYFDSVEVASKKQTGAFESIQGFASKVGENLLRLCGVTTGIEYFNAYKNDPANGLISETCLDNNTKIMDYFLEHQLLIVNGSEDAADMANAVLLRDWIQNNIDGQFVTQREMQISGPGRLRKDQIAREAAIALLEKHHWLEPRPLNAAINGFQIRADSKIWKFYKT